MPNEIENILKEILKRLENSAISDQSLGDWIGEEDAQRLTGLKKSSLFNLRKKGMIRYSRLTKRKVFYRRSDLEKLLDENEKRLINN